jgi:hypothetical protein
LWQQRCENYFSLYGTHWWRGDDDARELVGVELMK